MSPVRLALLVFVYIVHLVPRYGFNAHVECGNGLLAIDDPG